MRPDRRLATAGQGLLTGVGQNPAPIEVTADAEPAQEFTLENLDDETMTIYYQIDYTLTAVPDDAAYFHAQFRRSNPLPYMQDYTILDGVRGRGHYVGTYMAWGVNNAGWWGEGEIKFYMDGDGDFPTICGTGTEDYFCGAYNFDVGAGKQFLELAVAQP